MTLCLGISILRTVSTRSVYDLIHAQTLPGMQLTFITRQAILAGT